MANIITILEKEIERKNIYLDVKGNTITAEKIEAMSKKSYVADLKAGTVDFAISFEKYHADILADYLPVEALINIVKDALEYESPVAPAMPEPAESVAI